MAAILPNPAMQDLKLTFHEYTLVFPSQETEKRSIFLSNIDQILNYNIPTANFFPNNPNFPPEFVAKRLKIALEKVLVPFDFMAGRLKLNQESGRLEIECNASGVGFVVASSELSLHEIGDLGLPNLGFQQLAVQSLNSSPPNGQPLCIFQVTSFKCGGFAIGMSVNHILFDGIGAKIFKENLASQAFDEDKPLPFPPSLDRTLLCPRSPPLVAHPHPEFFKPNNIHSGPPVFDCKKEKLDYIIFKLSPNDINFLKNRGTQENDKDSATSTAKAKVSSFNATAALMWRCKALSYMAGPNSEDRVSTLLNVVDLRTRVDPPLPPAYCANAVLCAYSSAQCGEIEKGPFWKLVEKVAGGPARVTSEYAKSAIDWLEVNRGLPCGEYMVSSWLRLGFDQVVYPWGRPLYVCPVVSHRKDICWVFPDGKQGINALVSLPPQEMERFKFHFEGFFES